jgi:hypothetical protein
MSSRSVTTRGLLVAITAVLIVAVGVLPAMANRQDTRHACTWGGTPAAPTGTFQLSPGLTNTPAVGPLHFVATGDLAGEAPCSGTLTFVGDMTPRSTCAVQELEGRVTGLPGVVRFWGRGAAGAVHEFMYDRDANVVGADQPQTSITNYPADVMGCNSPEGLTSMTFSAVVELFTSNTGDTKR